MNNALYPSEGCDTSLKRWGFTPQRPLERALEHDSEAVRASITH
ncbi:MAG: winged helix-turn-helix domain-containing protein [Azoarcus sp.]|nr:winged helix-turn-helix domain-containing protein [Azoarcus sp.]